MGDPYLMSSRHLQEGYLDFYTVCYTTLKYKLYFIIYVKFSKLNNPIRKLTFYYRINIDNAIELIQINNLH